MKTQSFQADISSLVDLAEKIGEQSMIVDLKELSEKLNSNRFYLVILGLFKRGKSSLINALIGQEIAPVAVTPTTAIITFFEHSATASAEVLFTNGSKLNIEIADVAQYVAEENNPKNIKGVHYLRVFAPSPILEEVVLVDTPGIGSLFSHNSDTTVNFLPRIDAAIYILSADVPISKSDEELLRDVNQSVSDIVFVLNKMDLLSSEELVKMLNYNLKMILELFPAFSNEVNLIPVSAREYFAGIENGTRSSSSLGNIPLLKNALDEHIIKFKQKILYRTSIRRLSTLTDQLATLISIRYNMLQLPIDELEGKRLAMQRSIEFFNSGKDDFEAVVSHRIEQLNATVAELSEKTRIELTQFCDTKLIINSDVAWEQIVTKDANGFYLELSDYIISHFNKLKQQLEDYVKVEFDSILLQYSHQSHTFLNELVNQMEQILGINVQGIISSFNLDVYSSYYLKEDIKYTIPSLNEKIIYKILPDKWIKRIILKQIYTNCMDLISPNAGRIRSDISYKTTESLRRFKSDFNRKFNELLQNLKGLIDESIRAKQSIHTNVKDKQNELERYKLFLTELQAKYKD